MSTDRPIESSRALVLLIPAGPPPRSMLDDLRRARDLGKPIIAVLRSGYAMPDGLDDARVVRADTPAEMADAIAKILRPSDV